MSILLFRYFLFVILLTGISMPCFADSRTILIFGDSLSAGHGLERGQDWPSLLQTHLQLKNQPYSVVNHSISGETTSGGLSRILQSLQTTQADIIILELGANDGLRGLSLKSMRHNLQQMINIALQEKAKILLIGMQLPSNYGETYSQLFQQQFIKLTEDNHLNFQPFLMANMSIGLEMYQADGLHPTAAAQPQIMQNVWQALESMLPEKGS